MSRYIFTCGHASDQLAKNKNSNVCPICKEGAIHRKFNNCITCGAEFETKTQGHEKYCEECKPVRAKKEIARRLQKKAEQMSAKGYSDEYKIKMSKERSDCIHRTTVCFSRLEEDAEYYPCAGCLRYEKAGDL